MGINDPYDRTGQYSGGDKGPKSDGFAHGMQPDGSYVGDRRDHAIGTMVGDGYTDNRQGYGAVLDVIENRISAIDRFSGRGAYGHYGTTKTGQNLAGKDISLEGVVNARTATGGYQFSNWSPKNENAYAQSVGAMRGSPVKGTEERMAQAMDVYDTYYDQGPLSTRGVAQGGTFYQNKDALSAKNARGQLSMQGKYGGLAVGTAGHVVTGPGLTAFGKQAYGPAAPEQISGTYADDELGYSYTDELGNYHEFAGFVDDPMEDEAYGPATASFTDDPMNTTGYDPSYEGSFSGSLEYADGLGGNFSDDIANGMTFDFADDPMNPTGYGPATAQGYEDSYADAYGTGYAQPTDSFEGIEQQDGFVGSSWGVDPLGDYAEFTGTDDPMGNYGTGYAQPTETVTGQLGTDAFGFGSYDDAMTEGYKDYTGTDDPMQPDAYGTPAATPTEDPMQPDAYGTAMALPAPPTASPTPAPARSVSTTPPQQASFTPPQSRQTQARTQAAPAAFAAPQSRPQSRPAPSQQPSVPFGRVGGFGDPAATTMRSDRSIADNQGAYGGKDAFGPSDAFGGMGFGRSEYGGYANVVDSFNRATGDITRSITDRNGNVVDQRSVNVGGGSWNGEATGDTGMSGGNDGRGGGSVGDGSYSESSGRNDNNPQGIL